MKKKGGIGSSFDDFLKQEGIYEEVTGRAIKRVIVRPQMLWSNKTRDAAGLTLKTDKTPPDCPP
jgi:hypothetical protein